MSSTITKFFASFLAYGVANKKKRFSAIGRFSEGLAPVKGKIQWGYINKEYDIVIPLMYERAFSFKEGLGMSTQFSIRIHRPYRTNTDSV